MSEDSRYKFRFGTYGSMNPIFSKIEVEDVFNIDSNPLHNLIELYEGDAGEVIPQDSTTLKDFIESTNGGYFRFKRPIGYSTKFNIKISADIEIFKAESNITHMDISSDIFIRSNNTDNTSLYSGTIEMRVIVEDIDTSESGAFISTYIFKKNTKPSKKKLTVRLYGDSLPNHKITGVEYHISTEKVDTFNYYEFSNLEYETTELVSYAGTKYIYPLVDNNYIYLCPWELKHVDSITISYSGTTSTMGIPNKPASRTQIFDTGGPVRTIKISGKRYDWEEDVSNWDFVNTQFNLAKDSEYVLKNEDTNYSSDNRFCYIGLSWLLSTMQVLLKGYMFYIGNDDISDKRFLFSEPYSIKESITLDALPPTPQPKDDGAIVKIGSDYWICKSDENGLASWKSYTPPIDNGFNVSLISVNTTFSESEPGLLEYSLTLVERRKIGDISYQPYNPEYVEEIQ